MRERNPCCGTRIDSGYHETTCRTRRLREAQILTKVRLVADRAQTATVKVAHTGKREPWAVIGPGLVAFVGFGKTAHEAHADSGAPFPFSACTVARFVSPAVCEALQKPRSGA